MNPVDDKITIRRVLHEIGAPDCFVMWSTLHSRWEVWHLGNPTYGSTTRSIIRAVKRRFGKEVAA